MAVFNEPNQWEHPLGNNADTSTLPDDAAATAGIASLQKLFQIINATPLEAGGIAPDREDVNALFKYLGDSIFYAMNGGVPSYNAAYDYIPGRVVRYTDNNLYKCIQANGASSTVVAPTDAEYWLKFALNNELADYLPLAGGNITGNLTVQNKNVVRSVNGVNADENGNVIYSDITESNKGVSYLKLSDGTLIQRTTGAMPNTEVNFPVPFLNAENISIIGTVIGEAVPVVCNINTYTKTYFRFNVFDSRTGDGYHKVLSVIAIGRWK